MNEACEQKKKRCSVSVGDACSHSAGFGRFRYIRRYTYMYVLLLQQLGLWYFKMYGGEQRQCQGYEGEYCCLRCTFLTLIIRI